MRKEVVRADVTLIKCLHTYWIFPHFTYLQGGDQLTGDVPGYQARLLLVRYFLMHNDLKRLEDGGWKQNQNFEGLVDTIGHLDTNEKDKMQNKMKHIVNVMLKSLTKHFDPWANQLLFLSIFSERETATIVASLIVGSPSPCNSSPTRFLSTLHGCEVDLQQFEEFVRQ